MTSNDDQGPPIRHWLNTISPVHDAHRRCIVTSLSERQVEPQRAPTQRRRGRRG